MISYSDAGVDVQLSDKLIEGISSISSEIGKYAANCYVPSHNLVMSCDGVGTKILLAKQAKEKYGRSMSTIGEDCVAMVVNDIICENAIPLFFMDYFASNKLTESDFYEIISGIESACNNNNIKLVGGETAELPGMFTDGALDVCGFGVGAKITKSWENVEEQDMVFGIHSTGIHSNGFSLIRKILENTTVTDSFLDELLVPTPIYMKDVQKLQMSGINIKALAHITGGGFKNLSRIIPKPYRVMWHGIDNFYAHHNIFEWIQKYTKLSGVLMRQTFNCGIGMVVIASPQSIDSVPLDNVTYLGRIGHREA